MATNDDAKALSDATFAYQKAQVAYDYLAQKLATFTFETTADVVAFRDLSTQLDLAMIDLNKASADVDNAMVPFLAKPTDEASRQAARVAAQSGIDLYAEAAAPTCEAVDQFAGFRFYDGSSFGYVRLFADRVELLVDEPLEYELDGTKMHTFRVTGRGDDVKLYVDGVLAIDATGKFTRKTLVKQVEFGDIAGRNQQLTSSWDAIKYSISGAYPPNATSDYVLEEVASFPAASTGKLRAYNDALYASVDPNDPDKSSQIYRFKEGFLPESRSLLAVTNSNITAVVIDPYRNGNIFGTTGKYLGTPSGLQYLLGSKPFPLDVATIMDVLPDQNGWTLEQNCEGDCASIANEILTLDTTGEVGEKFHKYTQKSANDPWVEKAQNQTGWTVEVRVKIFADGTGGTVDARSIGLISQNDKCLPPNARATASGEMPPDTTNAPGVLVNDGTYEEFVQFFQKGIGLKYASLFGEQDLTDQFYTIRIIGKGTAIAVYAKGDNEKSYRRLILAPEGLSVKTQPKGDQELPSIIVDDFGFSHAVWQDSRDGHLSVYHAQTGASQILGQGTISCPGLFPDNNMLFARTAFGLPAAGIFDKNHLDKGALVSGHASFISWGVRTGDTIIVYDQEALDGTPLSVSPRKYKIKSVVDEAVVVADTAEDLSTSFAFASFVVMRGDERWLAASAVSTEPFDSSRPQIIKTSDGELYVAYQNEQTGEPQVYLRRGKFDPFSTSWKDTMRITNSAFGAKNPQVIEIANQNLLVAWEDSRDDRTGSRVYAAVVSMDAFGAEQTIVPVSLTPDARRAKNIRITTNGSRVVIAYQDDVADPGKFDVYTVDAKVPSLADRVVTQHTTSGTASFPSACAYGQSAFLAFSDETTGANQIYALIGQASLDQPFSWGAVARITSSRGNAIGASVVCDTSGNAFIVFSDDRVRKNYPDLYVARYDGAANEWLSSAQNGLDVRIESYISTARRPSVSRDLNNNLAIAFEATKDGSRSRVAYVVYDGALVTIDETVSAYFPLDDNTSTTTVKNKIRVYRGSAVPPLEMVLAIDHSTAMNQNSNLNSVKAAASYLISQLTDKDMFNIVTFADIMKSSVTSFSSVLVQASSANKADGDTFVAGIAPSDTGAGSGPGGVVSALSNNFDGVQKLKLIVLLSAGKPGATEAESAAFRSLVKGLNTNNVYIFAFSAGPSNENLLNGLAQDNRGSFFMADSAVDLASQISDFYDMIQDSDYAAQLFDFAVDTPQDGTASKTTDLLHIAAPDPGISSFDPLTQAAFYLAQAGNVFSVSGDLVHKTGAVDVWLKPVFASTDMTTRVFFGSASLSASTSDSISCGMLGGSLKLRVVDSNGKAHETVAGPSAFSWAAGDLVHLRAVWDENSIGVSSLNGLSFADATKGYACAGNGLVFKTTDGGDTWSPLITGTTYELYSIDFPVDDQVGFACGEMGTVLKTEDGGATWMVIDTGVTTDLFSVFFKDNSVGYAAGESGVVLRTSDGGATWTDVSPAAALSDFRDVAILYDGVTRAVVAVGADSQLYRWVDDGSANVNLVAVGSLPESGRFNGISRAHQAGGFPSFVVGDDKVLMKTSDAGATWQSLDVEFDFHAKPDFRSVSHDPAGLKIYAVGQLGALAHSADGGTTWQVCTTGLKNGFWRSVDANFHGTGSGDKLVAVGAGGSVMISDNGGAIQRYSVTRSGNLCLQLDGKELAQTRLGDQPFEWDPTVRDLYFGDFDANGTACAGAVFDDIIIYRRPPPSVGGLYRRKDMWTFQSDSPTLIQRPEMDKRMEWGSISPKVKTKSYWSSVNLFLCGAKEPLAQFAWTSPLGLVDNVIRGMALDQNSRLWLATENGICNFDTSSANDDIEKWLTGKLMTKGPQGRFINYTNLAANLAMDSVSSIAVDGLNNVWAGTSGGLMILENQTATYGTSDTDPVDTSGSGGLGSLGSGEILNMPQVPFKVMTTAQGLPSNNILCVKAFGNTVYVGTDNGLAVITQSGVDPFANAAQAAQQDAAPSAADIAVVPSYDLRVFTVFNGLPSNRVQAIVKEKSSGDIWIGTDAGAARFFPNGSVTYDVASGLIDNDVLSLTLDNDDRKYAGTGHGMTRVEGIDFASFLPSDGLGIGAIVGGAADSTGHLWFATSTGLVEMFECDGTDKFVRYDAQDGIIGNPLIKDFQRYYILGGAIPHGSCEKALVSVSVNGVQLSEGYRIEPRIPWIVFDQPLSPSDMVEAFVQRSWRKVYDFDQDNAVGALAAVETDMSTMFLYSKRIAAGDVTLGANQAQGYKNSADAMYAVFVKALPGSTGTLVGAISSPAGAVAMSNAQDGISTYSDEVNTVNVLPSELSGVEYIQLPKAGVDEISEDYLQFSLAAGATVYVAYDSRATALPDWLRDFEPVKAIFRVTDMEPFTDGSNQEKLFVSVAGTNGCLYDILEAPSCDVSATIPMDATGPSGCATITRVNTMTNVTLSITADDPVTGVAEMQVSAREDFTTDGTTAVAWVPFQTTYNLEIPLASSSGEQEIVVIDPLVVTGTPTLFYVYNNDILVGMSDPGSVYKFDQKLGTLVLLFDTGEDEITSLASFGKYLFVGTGVDGKVFYWDGTTLLELLISGSVEDRITAMIAYNNTLFIGTSPNGKIFQVDQALSATLFKDTYETAVTGFAIFGGRLFWTTMNDQVSPGDVLSTVTRQGHRHTITAPSGVAKITDVNGTTSTVKAHSHAVVNGMLQPAQGHTHALNGSSSGKVFRHDIGVGQTTIVHSDRDYDMTCIVSTSPGSDGLVFAGTFPNGRILRYIPEENVFIKSFDTMADTITNLKYINTTVYAVAENSVYMFDGRRWQYVSASAEDITDLAANGLELFVLKASGISAISGKPLSQTIMQSQDKTICAYVRFKDAAGNVTNIRNDDGTLITCYAPCVKISDLFKKDGTTETTTTLTQVHRLLEINDQSSVLFSLNGAEAFLSGNRVEEEIGIYESEVFNGTNSFVQWVKISWLATAPSGTSVTIAIRTASTLADVANAEWGDEFTDPTGNDLTNRTGQFLQFRATLKVTVQGTPSPDLQKVDIEVRTSQATHYYTTNFVLPDRFTKGLLVYNGCTNPPVTDVVFGVTGQNSTDFGDYLVITPGKVFNVTEENQTKNLRVGIKFISSPEAVPVVDEFALLFELANDAIVRLNLPGTPGSTSPIVVTGATRTVMTDQVMGHVHSVTFDSTILDKAEISGSTSINAGHSHSIASGTVQTAAGHEHVFEI